MTVRKFDSLDNPITPVGADAVTHYEQALAADDTRWSAAKFFSNAACCSPTCPAHASTLRHTVSTSIVLWNLRRLLQTALTKKKTSSPKKKEKGERSRGERSESRVRAERE